MAKHPVPKKKVSQARTARRYATFVKKKHAKILNMARVNPCPSCGQPVLLHHACPNCGMYHGKPLLRKGGKKEKITKVKV